jgi:hypothetical protein
MDSIIFEDYSTNDGNNDANNIPDADNIISQHEMENFVFVDDYISSESDEVRFATVAPCAYKQNVVFNRYIDKIVSVHKEAIKYVEDDPYYQQAKPYMDKAAIIHADIKRMITDDPRYQYMKPYIDNTLTVFNVASLIVSVGTLNPVAIMYSLYALS